VTSSVLYIAWNSMTGFFYSRGVGFYEPNANHATQLTQDELDALKLQYVNVHSRQTRIDPPSGAPGVYFIWNKRQIMNLVHQANRMHRDATGKKPDSQSCFVFQADIHPGYTSLDGLEQVGHFKLRSAQGDKTEELL